jgi:hypothetical protein
VSLLPTCCVCDALLRGYNGDTRCPRCEQPCPECGGDVAYCRHKLTDVRVSALPGGGYRAEAA